MTGANPQTTPAGPVGVSCTQCGRSEAGPRFQTCRDCSGDIRFAYPQRERELPATLRSMWDFADRLPVQDPANIVTLGEGATPLLPARLFEGREVYWKNEGANPTGSQKDRAISVAISVAKEAGFERVVTVSTSSVGFACAAYCARAGFPCVVLVPKGTPAERLRPMLAFGAQVAVIEATFTEIEGMLDAINLTGWYEASTIQKRNCYQSEGPKTIAFEIVQQLEKAPDWVVVPMGGGGTLSGIWKGFEELKRDGLIDRVPRLLAVQSRRFNLFERYGIRSSILEDDVSSLIPDESEVTVLRNLKHAYPPDAASAMRALHATNGTVISVTDKDALSAQLAIARSDGIFCEPSSAVAAAAIARAIDDGLAKRDECIVGLLTGSGLRETSVLSTLEPKSLSRIDEGTLEQLVTG